YCLFFFSSRRRHTRFSRDWSSDVCSSDLALVGTLRMGAADSFALTHLSALLARIASKHPAAHVELDVDFSANLDRKLRAAELDRSEERRVGKECRCRLARQRRDEEAGAGE